MKCPCGRNLTYQECCGIAHANPMFIKTAEDLMRSRYSGFVLAKGDYLIQTHHSLMRSGLTAHELTTWAKSVRWVRLEIVETVEGREDDAEGIVEFKAYLKERGKLTVRHERSQFKRENGAWSYWDMLDID